MTSFDSCHPQLHQHTNPLCTVPERAAPNRTILHLNPMGIPGQFSVVSRGE